MTWRVPEDPLLTSHRTRTNVTIEVDGRTVAHGELIGADERGVFIAIPAPPITTTEEHHDQ